MPAGPDPNRQRPGDDAWAGDTPGDVRGSRLGLSSGVTTVIAILVVLAVLAVVIF